MSPETQPEEFWYVYIDRKVIEDNAKNGTFNPPIRIQKGLFGDSLYCSRAAFSGEVIYRPSGDSFIPFVRNTADGKQILPGDTGTRLVIACSEEPTILE